MVSKSKKFLSALCAIVVLISSYAGFVLPLQVSAAGNTVSDDLSVDTLYDSYEETDIKVMSYNVLMAIGTDAEEMRTVATKEERQQMVPVHVKAYSPDVIGFQEVIASNGWVTALKNGLSDYTAIPLSEFTSDTTIANGLMIMYKTAKYDCVSKGASAFTNADGSTSSSRWFQWAILKDKSTGQQFVFYNTHLEVGDTDTNNANRVAQCEQLVTHLSSTLFSSPKNSASRMPFFITGDFNTRFSNATGGLEKLTVKSFIDDAASVADLTRFVNPGEEIDHIFVNPRYIDVKEYHSAVENVNGRITSDHAAQIAYCKFRPHATIDSDDLSDGMFEASTSANTFKFNVNLGSRADYDIYDENNNRITTSTILGEQNADVVDAYTVNLSKRINRFYLKFYDGANKSTEVGNYIATVEAVITNTSVAIPTFAPSGAVNSYFANNALHVLVNDSTNNLSLSASNATFYTTANASGSAVTSASLSAGRTVRYLKTSAGDIYPVYIYKKTATANSSAIYVDVNIPTGESGEQVAFYNGKDVVFTTRGTNGFTTVAEAATNAKANGTVYFAPGKYSVNNTSDTVVFDKSVTLLGANYDVSAVNKIAPNWSIASRSDETIIDGSLVFMSGSNLSITVKGFKFEGKSVNGPIYIADTTTSDATRAGHVQTLDIQNNIFVGGGNATADTAPSAVQAYSGAQVKGLIKNNYFRCTINNAGILEDEQPGQTRALRFRNVNGLSIENNYFKSYERFGNFTDEISAGSTTAGYLNYAFTGNRFEHCGTMQIEIKNIQQSTSANVVFYNNEVVRSGPARRNSSLVFMNFVFDEGSLGNYCPNINISLYGNRFSDCCRVFVLKRSLTAAATGDLAQMKFKFSNNQVINPTERKFYGRNFYIARFDFYTNNSTKATKVDVRGTWDFSGNTFKSTFLENSNVQDKCLNKVNPAIASGGGSESYIYTRQYNFDIPVLNYIWNCNSAAKASQAEPIKIDSTTVGDLFDAKTVKYGTIADDFAETLNKATGNTASYDLFRYDFNDDVSGIDLTKKELSAIRDKMVFGTDGTSSDAITISNNKTLKISGKASAYTENSWSGLNKIEFKLKTDSTDLTESRSAVHFKFSHDLEFWTDSVLTNESFYSGTHFDGLYMSLATVDGVPTIKLVVPYINSSNARGTQAVTFENVVSNLQEFNTYKIVEAKEGFIDLYANDTHFARVKCFDNTSSSSSADGYYQNIQVFTVDAKGKVATTPSIDKTNTLVRKYSSVAFTTKYSSKNTAITNIEIDDLFITEDAGEFTESFTAKIDGVLLSLSDEINMKFVVNKETFDEAGYSKPVVKAVFGTNTYEIQGISSAIDNVSYYVFTFENVSPQMMNDMITATLFADFDGETVQGVSMQTSVAQYVYNQLSKTTDSKLRTLLVDMLQYGASAQLYTKYNQENLANAALTTEQASWGTQTMRQLVSTASAPNFDGDVKWLGMSLNLDNKVKIQGYFNAPVEQGMYIKVTNSNNTVIHTIQQEDFRSEAGTIGSSAYSFVFDKLTLKQMSEKVGFTVYNAQGQNISGTIFYSIESYAQRNQSSSNTALVNLLKSMMKYGDAARAYAG